MLFCSEDGVPESVPQEALVSRHDFRLCQNVAPLSLDRGPLAGRLLPLRPDATVHVLGHGSVVDLPHSQDVGVQPLQQLLGPEALLLQEK